MTGMNRTLVEWADYGWSPIVGCRNGCSYCYARNRSMKRMVKLCPKCATFEPHFHEERITQAYARQKPGIVFADPFADPWSDGVRQEWRDELLIACSDHPNLKPEHRFVLLTKRPERITEADTKWMGGNLWLGVSITSGEGWHLWETLAKLPAPGLRSSAGSIHKFVSVEPLLDQGVGTKLSFSYRTGHVMPQWVIVGPQSGLHSQPVDMVWQGMIRQACEAAVIPLFEKAGLPLTPAVRQMPPALASVFRKGGLT